MISVDTNILARVILDDDEKQSKISKKFLLEHAQKGDLYISSYVVLELAWLLKSKAFTKQKVIEILDKIIHLQGADIGNRHILIAALDLYAKHNVSFADCLITMDGKLTKSAETATFDRVLCKASSLCDMPSA